MFTDEVKWRLRFGAESAAFQTAGFFLITYKTIKGRGAGVVLCFPLRSMCRLEESSL